MHAVRIYREPSEVAARLAPFGVTVTELADVARAVVAARNDVVSVDARTAAGTKAYLAGVRHLRFLFLPKGWQADSSGGVESVVHMETGIRLVYQSVDEACVGIRGPQAINGKGPAAEAAIRRGQGLLFREEDLPEIAPERIALLNSTVWFFCLSVNTDDAEDIRVELALPAAVEGGNFRGFIERIFIIKPGEWNSHEPIRVLPDQDDDPYEVRVIRK